MVDIRKLGSSDIEVSALGMGCWAIGGEFWEGETPLGWGQVDDQESIKAIHRALDFGVNLFDTADVYGAGHSERVLAKALEGKRTSVVIATKFSNVFDEESRQVLGNNAEPDYIMQACEDSLRRLDTDYIDLYLFHDNALSVEKAGPVMNTLEQLVQDGKIRAYGWSTDFVDRAELFAQGKYCVAIQFQHNVLDQNKDMLAVCESNNLAAINRGPLAMGLLSGKYNANSKANANDVRGENSPDWMNYFIDGLPNPAWLAKLDALKDILMSSGRSLPQGALAWLWACSDAALPIPGFRTVAQVEENCKVLEFGPLEDEQMNAVDDILGSMANVE